MQTSLQVLPATSSSVSPITPTEKGTLGGRICNLLGDAWKDAGQIALKFSNAVIHPANGVDTVQKTAKVFLAVFLIVEYSCKGVVIFAKTAVSTGIDFVDGVQIFGDINDIAQGVFKDYWNRGYDVFVGNVTLVVANASAFLHTVGNQLSLVNLQSVATKMGGYRLFGVQVFAFVPKLALETVGRVTVVIGYILVNRETVQKLMKGENVELNRRVLIYSTLEVLFQLAVLASTVGSLVLALRLTAAVADVAKMYTKSNLK